MLLPLLLPLQGKRRQWGKHCQKKKKKLPCNVLHWNGTIQGSKRVPVTPASPGSMSELCRNRDQNTKVEGPGPEAATETQQGGSKCAKEVCKLTWRELQVSSRSKGTRFSFQQQSWHTWPPQTCTEAGDTGEAPKDHVLCPRSSLGLEEQFSL